jgi:hypothetical protein
MDQPKLFAEDIYDALTDVGRALGGSKQVGALLKGDAVPVEEAGRWVKDCLNRNRRERFDPAEVLYLLSRGREANCHSAMHFLCDQAGYERPKPLEPVDEQARLVRVIQEASAALKDATERLDRLSAPTVRLVK